MSRSEVLIHGLHSTRVWKTLPGKCMGQMATAVLNNAAWRFPQELLDNPLWFPEGNQELIQLASNTTMPVIPMQTAGTWHNEVESTGLGWKKG